MQTENINKLRKQTVDYLNKAVKDFQDIGINTRFEIQETLEDVVWTINEYTIKCEMDLIMAAHG